MRQNSIAPDVDDFVWSEVNKKIIENVDSFMISNYNHKIKKLR